MVFGSSSVSSSDGTEFGKRAGVVVADRPGMYLERPAAAAVFARAEPDECGLIDLGFLPRDLLPRKRTGKDRGGIALGVGNVVQPVIREPASVLVEEPDPGAEPFEQFAVGLRPGLLNIGKKSILVDVHGFVGTERGQHARHHPRRLDLAVVVQIVHGIVGRADDLDVRARDQPARGVAVGREQGVRLVVDALRGLGRQHLVDIEIAFQFQLRPVKQRIPDRHGLHQTGRGPHAG